MPTGYSGAENAPSPFVASEFADLMRRVSGTRAPEDLGAAVTLMRDLKSRAPAPDTVVGAGVEVTRRNLGVPGRPMEVLVAAPRGPRAAPVLVAFHSGGLISGTAEHGLAEAAALARDDRVVVSVGFGLAPEQGYASIVEDGLAALSWVHETARGSGWDPNAIVLTGASGGGAIAFSTAALARDAGLRVAGLLLMSPMLDAASSSASMIETEGTGTWDRGWNRAGWLAALQTDDDRALVPASISAHGFPPTYLDVGSADALRSEVMARAEALWSAGTEAELHVWPGGFHGFDVAVPNAPVSRAANAAKAGWLDRLLSGR